MKQICKKDDRYKVMIKESRLVKNAIILLGGKKNRGGEERSEEGGDIEWKDMGVGEKISLIELLTELVKGGMEMNEEEQMKEVLMELEEEGNNHMEEEMDGDGEGEGEEEEGEEGKREEKREWEKLSESARHLVFVIESAKARREGKKSTTLKMMRKREEEMERKRIEVEKKGAELERRLQAAEEGREEERKEKEAAEQRNARLQVEIQGMKMTMEAMIQRISTQQSITPSALTPWASLPITSLDGTSLKVSPSGEITKSGNILIHAGTYGFSNCYIGGVLTSVYYLFTPLVFVFSIFLAP